jgi:hypothetical protein
MVAVRLPQHRHCAPRKIIISAIATIIIFCGAWGCLIALREKRSKQKNSPEKEIITIFIFKKKNKKRK